MQLGYILTEINVNFVHFKRCFWLLCVYVESLLGSGVLLHLFTFLTQLRLLCITCQDSQKNSEGWITVDGILLWFFWILLTHHLAFTITRMVLFYGKKILWKSMGAANCKSIYFCV